MARFYSRAIFAVGAVLLALSAVATDRVNLITEAQAQETQQNVLKRKVAIARFSNETVYGKSLLRDSHDDPLGKQASDILSAYLTQAEKFLVFERYDLGRVEQEQILSGAGNAIGVDTLIVGSIVEFGRSTDGQRGLFNKKLVQNVHAKVALRLVDVATGHVFHSATGEGDSSTESKTILGIGSVAGHDASLADKAISAAIEDVIEALINSLGERPWQTDILAIEGNNLYISGGQAQGLAPGERLAVMQRGKTIKSGQTGFPITLPPTKLAEIVVTSTFGDNETNEGSVTNIVSGQVPADTSSLFVTTLN